jgi:CheY-like chemotaxis protein
MPISALRSPCGRDELPGAIASTSAADEGVDLRTVSGRLSADIQAVVAAHYSRNLLEETKKGLYGRLKQGFYPLRAPIGYRIHAWQQPTMEITATGRGAYKRTRLTANGFPRGYLMRAKSIHGFATGNMVRALVPSGKKQGSYLARVAVRASGSFNLSTVVAQGISYKHCRPLQRADGYCYHLQPLKGDARRTVGRQSFVSPGDYVSFSVTDTGMGISKEMQGQIFDPFFTTKEVGKGTGLGLSTVYGIVKQSGGYIWVGSELGQGACFTICLPRVKQAIAPDLPAKAEARSRGTETILVAEDEEALREAVCDYLCSMGYTVLAAGSGKEALSVVSEHEGNIDLIITDMVMPGMSGRELAQMLGSLRPDLKTIFMSGYSDDAALRHGIKDTDATFLQKPFSLGTLARKVRETLGRSETVQ